MKHSNYIRFVIIAVALTLIVPAFAAAQTVDYDTFESSFENFAGDVASSLPLNSSIGNNTPDAYIGQLLSVPPHFSIGLTTGASTIPYKTIDDAMSDLDLDTGAIDQFSGIGVPLPAYTVDARVGGFLLPFDVGLKIGGVPSGTLGVGDTDLEYFLVGADVRYAVIEQNAVLPNVSVGVGYNYLSGQVFIPDVVDAGYEVGIPETSTSLRLSDPDLQFNWQSSVIDFKVQASKQFLIVTPFAGLGTSVGISSAGGGLESNLEYDDGTGYRDATSDDIKEIEDAFDAAGYDAPDLDKGSIGVGDDVNGWAFRAFGGVGFNILAFKLDLGLGYDLIGRNLMGSLSARFQL